MKVAHLFNIFTGHLDIIFNNFVFKYFVHFKSVCSFYLMTLRKEFIFKQLLRSIMSHHLIDVRSRLVKKSKIKTEGVCSKHSCHGNRSDIYNDNIENKVKKQP